MTTLSFPEDLCLLMLDDVSGSLCRLPGQGRDLGLAAAALLELSWRGRIELDGDGDGLTVADESATGDAAADRALAALASSAASACAATASADAWIRRLAASSGQRLAEDCLASLAERGIASKVKGGLFFLTAEVAHARRYPKAADCGGDDVRMRVMRALFSGEEPTSRDADLIGLAHACGALEAILSASDFEAVERRVGELRAPHAVCRAARRAVDADRAPQGQSPARRDYKPIPEAAGLPILGNALGMAGDLQAFLDDLYERYGPICRLRAPGRRIVVMGGREAISFILTHSQSHLRSARPFADFLEAMQTERSIIAMDGPDHIRLRRATAAGYARMKVADHLPQLIDTARAAARSWPVGKPFSVYPAMQAIAIPQLGTIATGYAPTEYIDDLKYWFDSLVISMRGDRPKFMRESRLRKVRPRIRELYRRALDMHDPQRRGNRSRDLIDEFMEIHRRDPQFLPETDLIASVIAPYIQALDPVAGTLGFALLRLLAEPKHEEALRAEADDAFAGGLAEGREIRGLSMTYAFLAEVMRCHTVSPVLLRTACNSFEFEGCLVPAGTDLWLAPAVVHNDPDYYPNPKRFEPERHLAPRFESRRKGAFVPFGVGPHSCLGDTLSRDQTAVTLATLLHCVEFERHPAGDHRLRLTSYPSLRPHPKCRLRVTRWRTNGFPGEA